MTPVVRRAESFDADACNQLEAECRAAAATTRGAGAFFAQFPIAVRTSDGFTVVAEVEGIVVGFATIRTSQVDGSTIATIERVFVTPAARRVGVGDALIAGARSMARDRGCTRIDAMALPGDRDTKNLYERNGLTARLITASGLL